MTAKLASFSRVYLYVSKKLKIAENWLFCSLNATFLSLWIYAQTGHVLKWKHLFKINNHNKE